MAAMDTMTVFDEFARKYEIDDKTRKWLTSADGLQAKMLDDFLYAGATESDIGKIAEMAGAENKLLTSSRLRQAWTSLRRAEDDKERVKRRGLDDNDLDALLAQPALDDIAERHCKLYQMVWPPEIAPAVALVSRIAK